MNPITRRVALGAAAIAGLGGPALALPATASPSLTVVCSTAQVDVMSGVTATFSLDCSDSEGGAVDSYVVVAGPSKAASFDVDEQTGEVTYQSTPAASGTDSFTFKGVVVGLGESPVTTATLTFDNNRPVCAPVAALSVVHDRDLAVPIECTDADGDDLSIVTGVTGAAHGTVDVDGDEVSYRPTAGYVGADSFSLRAGDGQLFSEEVTVAVTVTNQAPVCTSRSIRVPHDTSRTISITCTDADGDDLTHSLAAAPQHGTATIDGDQVTYRPAARYLGDDSFRVTATDGIATTSAETYTVRVSNVAPTCTAPRTIHLRRGRVVPVRVVCRDADGDAVRLVVAQRPRFGKVVVRGTQVLFQADRRRTGRVVFRIAGRDGVSTGRPVVVTAVVRR
ncbi:Ig-like domain-containing protein [Nocardioides caeni]|uniref:Tandem-95 repeat protein n=1 Tax=Nocardioides caeni TaxID=574700 RepID=A0A4S8N365_9ACTN|nr:Ig-like domain-containing protein [Nocardioides caeni]THV10447.1 tandem-95 repeat protein [Nocardioides caeni]